MKAKASKARSQAAASGAACWDAIGAVASLTAIVKPQEAKSEKPQQPKQSKPQNKSGGKKSGDAFEGNMPDFLK